MYASTNMFASADMYARANVYASIDVYVRANTYMSAVYTSANGVCECETCVLALMCMLAIMVYARDKGVC